MMQKGKLLVLAVSVVLAERARLVLAISDVKDSQVFKFAFAWSEIGAR